MNNKKCPNCDATYAFLIEKSRLGCSFCYITFRDEIIWHLRKLQKGKTDHKGKQPEFFDDPVDVFVEKCIDNAVLIGDHDLKILKIKSGLSKN